MNFVNKWIRDGGSPEGKDGRRLVVAGVCGALAIGFLFVWWPISVLLGAVAVVKLKNAWVDKS